MTTRYPGTGIDDSSTLPNPATTDKRNSPSHAGLHDNTNDAIKATQTKLGTGSSTPVINTLMYGTGTGTSAWTQLTSSQLAASLADETGTGLAVFGTTPTLVTPKIDTINESTPGNGTTVGGVNIKSGALVTNNSVVTANIADANVTAPKMNNSGTWNSSWATASWSPTITGFSSSPANGIYMYTQTGKIVDLFITQPTNGTSNATTFTLTLPVTARTIAAAQWVGYGQIVDNGSVPTTPGLITITSAGTTLSVFKDFSGASFTSSGGKRLAGGFIRYEAA